MSNMFLTKTVNLRDTKPTAKPDHPCII